MIKKKNHILSSLFLGLLGGCITTIAIFLSIASSNFYSNLKSLFLAWRNAIKKKQQLAKTKIIVRTESSLIINFKLE